MTPKKIMDRLCEAAWISRMLSRKSQGRPGELLQRLASPEDREILRNLRAEDVQNSLRPEFFC